MLRPVIVPLLAAPAAAPAAAGLMRAAWPGWYGPGGRGDAARDLAARARDAARPGLPFGIVALDGDRPVGLAGLDHSSHGAAPGEGPWLVGLVVAPEARGRGLGSALVGWLEAWAAGGWAGLHATTGPARGLLMRRGWDVLRPLPDGQAVFRKGLS